MSHVVFDHVRKEYGNKKTTSVAIDDLSFSIVQGEFVGYAGPNGAGKSTSIKAMTGVLSLTSGSVEVCGMNPLRKRQQLARQTGSVFGQRSQMLWELPPLDFYDLVAVLYGVSADDKKKRVDELVETLNMSSFINQPVRSLSLGQRMRAELASALLPNPELLFLDEPTIGLDIEAKASIRELLRARNAEDGVTIVLTTHDLHDIEALCSRLMIIDHGRLTYDGTVQRLLEEYSTERTIEFVCEGEINVDVADKWNVEMTSNTIKVVFNKKAFNTAQIIQTILESNNVIDLSIDDASIEDVIRQIYSSNSSAI